LDPATNTRHYTQLALERATIHLFPSSWTVVHPISADSPLAGLTETDLLAAKAEFIVLMKAFDDTFSQTIYARTSYTAEEVLWGRRFTPMSAPGPDGFTVVDMAALEAVERVP
jgi:inward rectifier potassium channel